MQFNSDTVWENVYMAIIIAFERKQRELKWMDPKGKGGRVSKMCVWKSVTYHGVEEAAQGSLEGEEPKLNQTALLVHLTLPFGCWRLNSCPAASSTTQWNPRLRFCQLWGAQVSLSSVRPTCVYCLHLDWPLCHSPQWGDTKWGQLQALISHFP